MAMDEKATYAAQSGGYIVNASEIQSCEIDGPFACQEDESGWQITMQASGRISLNFRANMRKLDFPLLEGDRIIRGSTDILVIRTHPIESYRSVRSSASHSQSTGSPLARRSTTQMGSPLASDVEQIVENAERKN